MLSRLSPVVWPPRVSSGYWKSSMGTASLRINSKIRRYSSTSAGSSKYSAPTCDSRYTTSGSSGSSKSKIRNAPAIAGCAPTDHGNTRTSPCSYRAHARRCSTCPANTASPPTGRVTTPCLNTVTNRGAGRRPNNVCCRCNRNFTCRPADASNPTYNLNQSGITELASHHSSCDVPNANSANASVTLACAPYNQHNARTFATVTGTLPVSIRCNVGSEIPNRASATSRRDFPVATRNRVNRRPNARRTTRCPVTGTPATPFHQPARANDATAIPYRPPAIADSSHADVINAGPHEPVQSGRGPRTKDPSSGTADR